MAAGMALLSVGLVHCGPSDPGTPLHTLPRLERSVTITEDDHALQPIRIQLLGDTVYVAFRGRAGLGLFTPDLVKIGSVALTEPEPVHPSAFQVTRTGIVACDHATRSIVTYDRTGIYKTSYGLLPDGETRLSPLALTTFGGVTYVSDIAARRVLAISMVDSPGITSRGELILTIPSDPTTAIGLPSALHVTPDGRLLVGDARDGIVRVFTCDGRAIYSFDRAPGAGTMAPQGMAMDDVSDPRLRDPAAFDPSGVPHQGRVHVVDGQNGRVHMYNPLGSYIASYPEGEALAGPSDIAIDRGRRRIYVTDPPTQRILVYRYGE
jgi:hypothetical protein